MLKDRFDWLLVALLAAATISLLVLLATKSPDAGGSRANASITKAMEQQMATQARVAFLQKLYAPVETMRTAGDLQGALFKLDELARTYPGEAHSFILKGEIQHQLGADDEAIANYVQGIKLSGDYIDRNSPLSRRDDIQRLVDTAGRTIASRFHANPDNASLATAMKNVNYLKSRLAGGCE